MLFKTVRRQARDKPFVRRRRGFICYFVITYWLLSGGVHEWRSEGVSEAVELRRGFKTLRLSAGSIRDLTVQRANFWTLLRSVGLWKKRRCCRLIAGFETPDTGAVIFGGTDVTQCRRTGET